MEYPPTADLELKAAGETFVANANISPTSANLSAPIVADLQIKLDDYTGALTVALDPATRSRVNIAAKNAKKKIFLAALRAAIKLVKAGLTVTLEKRLSLGIPEADSEPTPSGAPETFPLTTLEPLGAARNKMRLVDSATPTKRRRPRNAAFAEVRMMRIEQGAPLPGPDAVWPITRMVSKTLSEIESDESDAGKTLVAQSRWVSPIGLTGPWGPLKTGTIAA
jgi:hypothetical protein